jgi:hypothetical protein
MGLAMRRLLLPWLGAFVVWLAISINARQDQKHRKFAEFVSFFLYFFWKASQEAENLDGAQVWGGADQSAVRV